MKTTSDIETLEDNMLQQKLGDEGSVCRVASSCTLRSELCMLCAYATCHCSS